MYPTPQTLVNDLEQCLCPAHELVCLVTLALTLALALAVAVALALALALTMCVRVSRTTPSRCLLTTTRRQVRGRVRDSRP